MQKQKQGGDIDAVLERARRLMANLPPSAERVASQPSASLDDAIARARRIMAADGGIRGSADDESCQRKAVRWADDENEFLVQGVAELEVAASGAKGENAKQIAEAATKTWGQRLSPVVDFSKNVARSMIGFGVTRLAYETLKPIIGPLPTAAISLLLDSAVPKVLDVAASCLDIRAVTTDPNVSALQNAVGSGAASAVTAVAMSAITGDESWVMWGARTGTKLALGDYAGVASEMTAAPMLVKQKVLDFVFNKTGLTAEVQGVGEWIKKRLAKSKRLNQPLLSDTFRKTLRTKLEAKGYSAEWTDTTVASIIGSMSVDVTGAVANHMAMEIGASYHEAAMKVMGDAPLQTLATHIAAAQRSAFEATKRLLAAGLDVAAAVKDGVASGLDYMYGKHQATVAATAAQVDADAHRVEMRNAAHARTRRQSPQPQAKRTTAADVEKAAQKAVEHRLRDAQMATQQTVEQLGLITALSVADPKLLDQLFGTEQLPPGQTVPPELQPNDMEKLLRNAGEEFKGVKINPIGKTIVRSVIGNVMERMDDILKKLDPIEVAKITTEFSTLSETDVKTWIRDGGGRLQSVIDTVVKNTPGFTTTIKTLGDYREAAKTAWAKADATLSTVENVAKLAQVGGRLGVLASKYGYGVEEQSYMMKFQRGVVGVADAVAAAFPWSKFKRAVEKNTGLAVAGLSDEVQLEQVLVDAAVNALMNRVAGHERPMAAAVAKAAGEVVWGQGEQGPIYGGLRAGTEAGAMWITDSAAPDQGMRQTVAAILAAAAF